MTVPWIAEDARWRLNADYPNEQRWADGYERVKDDLDHALTALAAAEARAEALAGEVKVLQEFWSAIAGASRRTVHALEDDSPTAEVLKRLQNEIGVAFQAYHKGMPVLNDTARRALAGGGA